MQDTTSQVSQTIRDAEALIAQVQADLDTAATFYRENNINPDKVMGACQPFLGAKEKAEIERITNADFEAVEQAVREGMAQINFAAANSFAGSMRKTRAMI